MRARDLPVVFETGWRYASVRRRRPRAVLPALLAPTTGRDRITTAERRATDVADRGLEVLRVRCLTRAIVRAEMLRARGVNATVTLSVNADDPRDAHADVAVSGTPLRTTGRVPFRPSHNAGAS